MSKPSYPWPQLLLVAATLIWGSSFLVMKQAVASIPVFTLLAIRFTVAGVLLSLIFWTKWRLLDKKSVTRGAVLGTLMFLGYLFQTFGLSGLGGWLGTTPGKNAFLTATYCVWVPFLHSMVSRRRPDGYHLAAAGLCLAGIGLVSLTRPFTFVGGDLLTLLSSIAYALHILLVPRYAEEGDVLQLTILQFLFMALWSWAGLLATGERLATLPAGGDLLRLGYLALFATALALLFQNLGQAKSPPASAAVLLSLEAPFGVFFSVLFGNERPTVWTYLGFFLIFCAMLLSETRLSFLPRRKKDKFGG